MVNGKWSTRDGQQVGRADRSKKPNAKWLYSHPVGEVENEAWKWEIELTKMEDGKLKNKEWKWWNGK